MSVYQVLTIAVSLRLYTCGVRNIIAQYIAIVFPTYLAISLDIAQVNDYDSKLASSIFSTVARFGSEYNDFSNVFRLCCIYDCQFILLCIGATKLVELLAELIGPSLRHLRLLYLCCRLLPSLQDVHLLMPLHLLLI